jgi:large subunit ribosomal protein L4
MDIPVYSTAGEVVGQFTVDEAALGGRPNMALLRQAILMFEANQRTGTAKAKRIDEVNRTSNKPWRQKHTGRARQGDRRSPIWVGGGAAHGPKPRNYRQKMPQAARRKAVCAAFLAKAIDGEVIAVQDLRLPQPKTREMAGLLRNLGVQRSFLVVVPEHDAELWRCTRNIPGAAMKRCSDLNAYEMIRPSRVIFSLGALERFVAEYGSAEQAASPETEEVGVSENG